VGRPTVVLVHGAANSSGVWRFWRERLEAHGVAIESVARWPRGGRSIYFRDPAGNSLELATPDLWDVDRP
jgi:catechol 2,3-dioxygenase-like lactoylglutathione lyase family enzyme